MNKVDNFFGLITGVVGGMITSLFGGWSTGIKVLLIIMLIDMLTGITSAIMNKSTKTDSGALNSYVVWKGILKKLTTLLMICMAYQLDLIFGTTIIRDATVIFYIFDEGVSVLENCGRIGIPLPTVITKALDILKEKSESTDIK